MEHGERPVAALWRARLARFLDACDASGPEDQADRLREAHALFRHHDPVASSVLDAMIAARAYESAALALVGPAAGYMLSRGGTGICLASVYLPGCEQRTCEGATPALALLAATATGLWHLADDEETGPIDCCVAVWLN